MWAIGMVHWMYDTKSKPENRYGVIPISRYSGSKLILQRNSCSQIPLKAFVACWFKLFPVYYKSLIPNARAQEVPWPYSNMSLGHTGHYIMILNYFSALKYDGFVIFCSFAPWLILFCLESKASPLLLGNRDSFLLFSLSFWRFCLNRIFGSAGRPCWP